MPNQPLIDAAKRAVEEIGKSTVCYGCDRLGECRQNNTYCPFFIVSSKSIAAIIERHFAPFLAEKDKRIAELEKTALAFFRAAVASNRVYPGDLHLLVDVAQRMNLCAETVEIHVNGDDVQIVGLKEEGAPCREK